jgi:hypothetical protein
MHQMRVALFFLAAVVASVSGPPSPTASARQAAQSVQDYDLLLKGGHVIDSRNNLSAVRDVAIKGGKVAAVARGAPLASGVSSTVVRARSFLVWNEVTSPC